MENAFSSSTCRPACSTARPSTILRRDRPDQSARCRRRERGGKVIWIQHCGPTGTAFAPGRPGWQFLPELQRADADIVVTKTLNDAFAGTDLQTPCNSLARPRPDRGMGDGFLRRRHAAFGGVARLRCRCRQRRPHARRSPAPRRGERDPSPHLGVGQPDHARSIASRRRELRAVEPRFERRRCNASPRMRGPYPCARVCDGARIGQQAPDIRAVTE